MPSTIAAEPNTRIIPPIVAPAIAHEIRPVIQAKPRQTMAMMAIILAQVPVSRISNACRKLVPESNNAPPSAAAFADSIGKVVIAQLSAIAEKSLVLFIMFPNTIQPHG